MATVTRTKTWNSGDTLTASDLNAEFDGLLAAIAIVNADVSGSAGIVFSKLDSTTVAGVTATQTLTNKTLTNPILTKPTVNGSVQGVTADTDGATITFDMTSANVHTVTLGGNRTLAVSNVTAGQFFYIRLLQDGTGSRTVTWFSTITWAGATAPTLTTTASRADLFAFFAKTATTFDGFIVGQNIG